MFNTYCTFTIYYMFNTYCMFTIYCMFNTYYLIGSQSNPFASTKPMVTFTNENHGNLGFDLVELKIQSKVTSTASFWKDIGRL